MRTLLLLVIFYAQIFSQQLYFPPLTGNTWETLSYKSAGWDSTKTDTLLRFLEAQNTKAFLALKDGKIVIEKYFGTFVQDSLWYWASAGKTLTSFMIGMAQQQGLLSINDTASKYLGRWTSAPADKERMITIRHQLTMTSGLSDEVADPYCTLPECLVYRADAGTRWAYHNGPYTLLDSVIQIATGQNLNIFFYNSIKPKTGMTGIFYKIGYNNVFFSTARSMARFGLTILNRGKWDTTPVMTDTAYFRQMTTTSQEINKSYGYLWWLNGKESYMLPQSQIVFPGWFNPYAPSDMISAMGKDGQFLNVVPGQKLIVIRMGNAPGSLPVPYLINNELWRLLTPVINPASAVDEEKPAHSGLNLEQNYPNPFTTSTKIKYSISPPSPLTKGKAGEGLVTLKIYDILGREAATLVNTIQLPGTYEADFNNYKAESKLSPGIYFYRLHAGDVFLARKMIIQ